MPIAVPSGYREYAGSTADFTPGLVRLDANFNPIAATDTTTPVAYRVYVTGGSAPIAIYNARPEDGGTRITTGLLNTEGNAVTEITSDADGDVRFFADSTHPVDVYGAGLVAGVVPPGAKFYRFSARGRDVSDAAAAAASAAVTWEALRPAGGIPESDLAVGVREKLNPPASEDLATLAYVSTKDQNLQAQIDELRARINNITNPDSAPGAWSFPATGAYWGYYRSASADIRQWDVPVFKRVMDITRVYIDFNGNAGQGDFGKQLWADYAARGSIVYASWEPRTFNGGYLSSIQPAPAGSYTKDDGTIGKTYTFKQILDGLLDNYINRELDKIAARPTINWLLAFDHENDDRPELSGQTTAQLSEIGRANVAKGTPEEYRDVCRKLVNMTRAKGIKNVRWCWTIAGWWVTRTDNGKWSGMRRIWPGSEYMDGGIWWDPYLTSDFTSTGLYNKWSIVYDAIDNGLLGADTAAKALPRGLGEWGISADAGRGAVVQAVPGVMQTQLPKLKGVCYFDSRQWRLELDPNDQTEFAEAGGTAYVDTLGRYQAGGFKATFTGTDGAAPAEGATNLLGTGSVADIRTNTLRLGLPAAADTSAHHAGWIGPTSTVGTVHEEYFEFMFAQVTAVARHAAWLRAARDFTPHHRPSSGYGMQIANNSGFPQLLKTGNITPSGGTGPVAGTQNTLATAPASVLTPTAGVWYAARFRCLTEGSGVRVQARIWKIRNADGSASGVAEPSTWNVGDVLDTTEVLTAPGGLQHSFYGSTSNDGAAKDCHLDNINLAVS